MSRSIADHLRGNVVGYVSLFFVFTGGAYALEGRNSVDSGDIQNSQVRESDLASDSVGSPEVIDDSLTGADVDESTLSGIQGPAGERGPEGPQGPPGERGPAGSIAGVAAGGDLTGSYPAPTIAGDAVFSSKIANNSVFGADIEESSLEGVPVDLPWAAEVDNANSCDPTPSTSRLCVFKSISFSGRARPILIMATGSRQSQTFDDPESGSDNTSLVQGSCRIEINGTLEGPLATVTEQAHTAPAGGLQPSTGPETFGLVHVAERLGGNYTVGLRCFESDGDLRILNTSIAAVALKS